jgi:predicted secreted protein
MKVRFLLTAGLAIGLASAAFAADDTNADATPVKEKKICRTETVTGSLVTKRRICLTKAEWDKLAEQTKQEMDKFVSQENGTVPTRRPGV